MNSRKLIIILLLVAFGIYVLLVCWIDLSYYLRLPKTPDAVTNQIYEVVVSHGSVRYGTLRELRFRTTVLKMLPIPLLFFFAALFLGLKWEMFHIGRRKMGQD